MIRPGFWRWVLAVALGVYLALWLAQGDIAATGRPYHLVPIAKLATTRWTHVRVCGLVTLVRLEPDGDVHVRLSDPAGAFAIGEIIPAIPLPRPKLRQRICVEGISRIDKGHGGWAEIHPVERWTVAP